MNAHEVISNIRAALARVSGAESISITRGEFEALAREIEHKRKRTRAREQNAQQLALELPGGLDVVQLRTMLARPKTAKSIARAANVSTETVRRALRLMPDVIEIGERKRAHTPGQRPTIYGIRAHAS